MKKLEAYFVKELQRKQTESVKYTEQELAAVAKRENNKKRTWLVACAGQPGEGASDV